MVRVVTPAQRRERTDVVSSERFSIELERGELREAFGFRSKDGEDRAVFRGPCREGLFLRPELRQVYRLVGKRAETALSGGLLSRCGEGLAVAGNSAQKRAAGARGI